MGGFMAWILGARNKDNATSTVADAESRGFDTRRQKPKPYFKATAPTSPSAASVLSR